MKTGIVFLCSALALAMSAGALAQDEVRADRGLYGGLGLGKAKAKLNRSDFSFGNPAVLESKDETETVYKAFGGYQFTRYIAAELSYTDFGKFAYMYDGGPILGVSRVNYNAKSWASSAVVSIPLGSSGFSAVGRVGVALNRVDRPVFTGQFSTSPRIPSATKQRLGFLWGAGASYDFTPSLSIRLEYEDYGKFGEATDVFFNQTGRATIHMYSLGFIARF